MPSDNPFYPGYYPGDRPSRTNGKDQRGVIPSPEFNPNFLRDYFEEQEETFESIPEWFADQIKQDLDFQLTARVYGENAPPESLEFLGAEEAQELPGSMSINLSLDPRDWLSDPGKQLNKTLNNWGHSMIDYEDLSGRVRERIWRDILLGPSTAADFKFRAGAVREEEKRSVDMAKLYGIAQSPFQVTGLSDDETVYDSKGNNLNRAFAKSVIEFQTRHRSSFARDDDYFKMLNSAADLVSTQIERFPHQFNTNELRNLSAEFRTKMELAESIDKTNEAISDSTKALTSFQLEKPKEVTDKQIDAEMAKLARLPGGGTTARQDREKVKYRLIHEKTIQPFADLRKNIRESELIVEKLETLVRTDSNYASLDTVVRKYRTALNDTKQALTQFPITPNLDEKGIRAQAKKLNNRLERISKGDATKTALTKGTNSLDHGLQRSVLVQIEKDLISKKGESLENVLGGRSGIIGRVRSILPRQEIDRQTEWMIEIMDNLEGGWKKFIRIYGWQKARNLLLGYTPAYYVQTFMERMQYFGLRIDEKLVGNTPRFIPYRIMDGIVRNTSVFKNTFRVTAHLAGGNRSFAFEGDKKLAGVSAIEGLLNPTDGPQIFTQQHLLQAFGLEFGTAGDEDIRKAAIKNFLQGITDGRGNRLFSKITNPDALDKAFDKMAGNIQMYAKWIDQDKIKGKAGMLDIKNIISTGTPAEQRNAADFLHKLTNSLHGYDVNPDNMGFGIAREHLGLLQRLAKNLNRFQTAVLNTGVGRALKGALGLKYMLTRSTSNAIVAALVSASGGILAPLAVPLKFAVQYAVEKVGKVVISVKDAIVKTDLTEVDRVIEKSMVAGFKLLAMLISVPMIGCLPIFLVMMVIISSITPNNPAKGAGGVYSDETNPESYETVPEQSPWADIVTSGLDCPIKNPALTAPSFYSYDDTNYSHGSNSYWHLVFDNDGVEGSCNFSTGGGTCGSNCYRIPATAMGGYSAGSHSSAEIGDGCSTTTPRNYYYGRAADYINSNYTHSVYIPTLRGNNPWMYETTTTGYGNGVILTKTDDGRHYKLLIHHINISSGVARNELQEAGKYLGEMWTWPGGGNHHIHVELYVNDLPVKPECWMCGGKAYEDCN